MIYISIFSCVASAVFGFFMGKKKGISAGYGAGYRDGRISCAREKRVAKTQLKTVEAAKSGKLDEDSLHWLG